MRDDLSVTGTYHVVIDDTSWPPTARGTIRFHDRPHQVHRALAVEPVLICFDGRTELEIEVVVYAPGASLLSFTCRDAAALLDTLSAT